MQKKYWNFMVQIKAWEFYLDVYAESSYKAERALNMFTAITSSTCIAAWAIWNQYNFIWALLIALSQVITAIKPYFPFSKRLEIIKALTDDVKKLFSEMEYNWYKVANGELTEVEINDLLYNFKKRYDTVESEKINTAVLVENQLFLEIADKKNTSYFENNF